MMHAHDVIHADIKPENIALDMHLNLHIIDLSGSSLCNKPPLSLESAAFYMPRTPENKNADIDCSVTTDLFALGSSFYQMVTCFPPWSGLDHDDIEARYNRGEFPDVATAGPGGTPMLFADTIWRCWHGQMASAADVLAALKVDIRAAFGPDDLAFIEKQSGISLMGAGADGV